MRVVGLRLTHSRDRDDQLPEGEESGVCQLVSCHKAYVIQSDKRRSTSISSAQKAIECVKEKPEYAGMRISFGKDRCAGAWRVPGQ
jgi:hypothetical protein